MKYIIWLGMSLLIEWLKSPRSDQELSLYLQKYFHKDLVESILSTAAHQVRAARDDVPS